MKSGPSKDLDEIVTDKPPKFPFMFLASLALFILGAVFAILYYLKTRNVVFWTFLCMIGGVFGILIYSSDLRSFMKRDTNQTIDKDIF